MTRKAKDRTKERTALEDRIGHSFADKDVLDRALTHISALSGGSRANSYQRLEFLGDHVLGLVVSDMLFRAYPRANEGEMSRRLAEPWLGLSSSTAATTLRRSWSKNTGKRA
jgi:ribonuclease-3